MTITERNRRVYLRLLIKNAGLEMPKATEQELREFTRLATMLRVEEGA